MGLTPFTPAILFDMLTPLTLAPLLFAAPCTILGPSPGQEPSASDSPISYSYFGVMMESAHQDRDPLSIFPAAGVDDSIELDYSQEVGSGFFGYARAKKGAANSADVLDIAIGRLAEDTLGLSIGAGYHVEPAMDWSLFGTVGLAVNSGDQEIAVLEGGPNSLEVETDQSGLELEIGARWRVTKELEWYLTYSIADLSGESDFTDIGAATVFNYDLDGRNRRLNLGMRGYFTEHLAGVIEFSTGASEREYSLGAFSIDDDLDVDAIRFGLNYFF